MNSSIEYDDDEPGIDFVFDGVIRPTLARPFSERAHIVALQDQVDEVRAGRRPADLLEASLAALYQHINVALRWCGVVSTQYPSQAGFFDTNRVAYLHAREGVTRMQLACRERRYQDWLPQGMAALESAVVDIDALVALEADGEE